MECNTDLQDNLKAIPAAFLKELTSFAEELRSFIVKDIWANTLKEISRCHIAYEVDPVSNISNLPLIFHHHMVTSIKFAAQFLKQQKVC